MAIRSVDALKAERLALKQKHERDRDGGQALKRGEGLAAPTIRLYEDVKASWETFMTEMEEPNMFPDLESIQIYMTWFAERSRGKLGQRSSVTTLLYRLGRFGCMYNRNYANVISDETLDQVRAWIRTDLKDELNLEDGEYEKEFAAWKDVESVLRNLILHDKHRYRDNRLRAQLIAVLLIVADDGERLGAIVRSESYRSEEAALCYQDVELFIRPMSSPTAEAEFKLNITYSNRKGERRDPKKYLTQTYTQRKDFAHCFVVWFLALAFLDNAVEGFLTPEQLFSKRNPTDHDIPVPFKQSILLTPIFRRMDQRGSRKLSLTLPWSSNSVNTEGKRAFLEAGFTQRFTFYNIRRGVSNRLVDSGAPDSRRKQLMGHSGPSDPIFRKFYQSRKYNIDVGNIYRGEAPRSDRSEILSMCRLKDKGAPQTMSKDLKKQLYDGDQTMKELKESRDKLSKGKRLLKGDAEEHVAEAIKAIDQKLNRRRSALLRDKHKEFHPDNQAALQSLPSIDDPWETSDEAAPRRPALSDALYPKSTITGSALNAIRSIITHCRCIPGSDEIEAGSTDLRYSTFAKEEDERLVDLRVRKGLPWKEVQTHFPGRQWTSLIGRLKRLSEKDPSIAYASAKGGCHVGGSSTPSPLAPKPSSRLCSPARSSRNTTSFSKEEEERLVHLRAKLGLSWKEVNQHFPNRAQRTLENHLCLLRKQDPSIPYVPRTTYSAEEEERLLELAAIILDWEDIAKHFPGKSGTQLRRHWDSMLTRKPPNSTDLVPPKTRQKRGLHSSCPGTAELGSAKRRKKMQPDSVTRQLEWLPSSPPRIRSLQEMSEQSPAEVIGKLVYNVKTGREEEILCTRNGEEVDVL